VVGLSDSPASPIIRAAHHGFVVAVDTPQFFPSSVATIAVLETLLSFVIAVASDEIVERVSGSTAPPPAWHLHWRSRMKDDAGPCARSTRATTPIRIFEVEKAGLLARTWQFACHASQLENPGDYVAFDLGDESLFCIRGRDGVIRTFYNVCQHRAHQLVSGEGSTRVVVCPYHAWTYELTGRLRAAPNTKSVPGFDRRRSA
jgi:nitrite reductase/ring-hydroxylating ferredoxin subunit